MRETNMNLDKATSKEVHKARVEKTTKSKVLTHAASIINKHFGEAIQDKEAEIDAINSSILEAQKALHLIRYGSVARTYTSHTDVNTYEQESLHPTTKALVAGKRPAEDNSDNSPSIQPPAISENGDVLDRLHKIASTADEISLPDAKLDDTQRHGKGNSSSTSPSTTLPTTVSPCGSIHADLPGYVGPSASNIEIDAAENAREPRGHQYKFKRRFVIGNVSKWIECDQREDSSTHKWMLYVRGCKEFPDVSDVVSKVRFFIHQTYAPNNVIDVAHPPYHLIRRGWGEFPARVQIHFRGSTVANKPVDVMHFIKLDKTYTGLQTLGAETVVDVWLQEVNSAGIDQRGSQSGTPNSTRPNSPLEGITIPAAVTEAVIEENEELPDISTDFHTKGNNSTNMKMATINEESDDEGSLDTDAAQSLESTDLDVGKDIDNPDMAFTKEIGDAKKRKSTTKMSDNKGNKSAKFEVGGSSCPEEASVASSAASRTSSRRVSSKVRAGTSLLKRK